MSLTLIIILIVAGLLFVLLEVLVIPGTTVVGIAGVALIAFSIWESYHVFGAPTGHYILIGAFFLTLATIVLAFKSNTWNRLALKTEISGKVNEIDFENIHPGDSGKAVSRISPSGKAIFNDEFFEVHTNSDFIDQETEVVVSHIIDNKIFVKRKS
ncbi:MAG: NfeD family protein [Bacteroidales bacterium]|jgi:membrane-bound ClpP family serine protease|nr:NfeD family protein [Bacteroidales bacterium]MBK9359539.1 NfeD family protein [Bacteroidales bacterium]